MCTCAHICGQESSCDLNVSTVFLQWVTGAGGHMWLLICLFGIRTQVFMLMQRVHLYIELSPSLLCLSFLINKKRKKKSKISARTQSARARRQKARHFQSH